MYYFRCNRQTTSNGSAATETDHYRLLTIAEQETAKLMEVMGTARSGTAGGGSLRVRRYATPSTGGTAGSGATLPNPTNAALNQTIVANTTNFTDATTITAGTTATNVLSIGLAQTGGQGGWVTPFDGAGIDMIPNGGAQGNLDFVSIFNAASIAIDLSIGFREGS